MFGRVYVNWSPIWTEREVDWVTTYTEFSEDISVNAWDLVQLFTKSDTTAGWFWFYDDFRIFYDEVITLKTPTINLDT